MRHSLLVLLCAASALAAQESRARIGLPGYRDIFPIEDVTVPYELGAPFGKSYVAVKAALAELKVELSVDDSAAGLIGNKKLSARLNFLGYQLSRLLDCGMNTMGQNADSFRLSIVFLALLDPIDATHTKLRVGFIGGGEPVSGPRRDAVTCGSTGVIEAKLAQLVSRRLP